MGIPSCETGPNGLLPTPARAADTIDVHRSHVNWRMVPVLIAALVIALVVTPGEAGVTLRHFGGVAGDAARQIHDGYMRLFR
jgi:hypothetical protein